MKKIISSILLVIFMSLTTVSCGQSKAKNTNKVEVINAQQFKKDSNDKVIVDVRTANEFKSGHLKNAINIDFFDKKYLDYFARFDKKEPLYLYCRSGRRSNIIANELVKIGFKKVYDLEGGIIEWENNRFEVEE